MNEFIALYLNVNLASGSCSVESSRFVDGRVMFRSVRSEACGDGLGCSVQIQQLRNSPAGWGQGWGRDEGVMHVLCGGKVRAEQTDRQTDRQTDTHTHTDRQTDTHTHTHT